MEHFDVFHRKKMTTSPFIQLNLDNATVSDPDPTNDKINIDLIEALRADRNAIAILNENVKDGDPERGILVDKGFLERVVNDEVFRTDDEFGKYNRLVCHPERGDRQFDLPFNKAKEVITDENFILYRHLGAYQELDTALRVRGTLQNLLRQWTGGRKAGLIKYNEVFNQALRFFNKNRKLARNVAKYAQLLEEDKILQAGIGPNWRRYRIFKITKSRYMEARFPGMTEKDENRTTNHYVRRMLVRTNDRENTIPIDPEWASGENLCYHGANLRELVPVEYIYGGVRPRMEETEDENISRQSNEIEREIRGAAEKAIDDTGLWLKSAKDNMEEARLSAQAKGAVVRNLLNERDSAIRDQREADWQETEENLEREREALNILVEYYENSIERFDKAEKREKLAIESRVKIEEKKMAKEAAESRLSREFEITKSRLRTSDTRAITTSDEEEGGFSGDFSEAPESWTTTPPDSPEF